MSKPEKVLVKDIQSLVRIVWQHGGGNSEERSEVPDNIKKEATFLCRVKCLDGTIFDFVAPDIKTVEQFHPGITEDPGMIFVQYMNEFVKTIADPNPLFSFIKGQAYIETMLVFLMETALYDPKELDVDHMTFNRKVKFCTATGLIHNDVSRVLLEFAKIRNKFAHQLWPEFTKKERQNLMHLLRQSVNLKERIPEHISEELDLESNINYCFVPVWMYLLRQIMQIEENIHLLNDFWKSIVGTGQVSKSEFSFRFMPMKFDFKKTD